MIHNLRAIKIVFVLICAFASLFCRATHNRGGEITFRHIAGYTYEITIKTVTYTYSEADRCYLQISWGDGTVEVINRVNGDLGASPSGEYCHLGEIMEGDDNIRLNIYTGTHTYAGNGTFVVSLEDPNRNYGIMNIPNSVSVPFYIETVLAIDNFMGTNDSPQTTLFPVGIACVGQKFIANAGAYDSDGDSLSYEIVACKGAGGEDIPGYSMPGGDDEIYINPTTGDFVWDAPDLQGEYNFAYRIVEWRNGMVIGYVTRDFQVNVTACNDTMPELSVSGDNCVIAGDTLSLYVIATDVDGDSLLLTVSGELFDDGQAVFTIDSTSAGFVGAHVTVYPNCNVIAEHEYVFHFKVSELGNYVNLSNFTQHGVKIIGAAPIMTGAYVDGNNIRLLWQKYYCDNIAGYKVYRTANVDNSRPEHCQTGVPQGVGYRLLGYMPSNGEEIVAYTDNGALSVGVRYSYRVVAYLGRDTVTFAESKCSDTVAIRLKKTLPVITHVSVVETDTINGKIMVIVSPPEELDTTSLNGKLSYSLFRSNSFSGLYEKIFTTENVFTDTVVYDDNINTANQQYYYYCELYNMPVLSSENILLGRSEAASSVFLQIEGRDRKLLCSWDYSVPWQNEYFRIHDVENDIVIDSVSDNYIEIDSLENGKEHCFVVETVGAFSGTGFPSPIINHSQQVCAVPTDGESPQTPVLQLVTDCENMLYTLHWNDVYIANDDLAGYYVYFKENDDAEYVLTDSVLWNDTLYNVENEYGCFAVSSFDVNGNESGLSNVVCVNGDECAQYVLPNVFTPNGDGYNDMFVPMECRGISRVDITFVNRQGRDVFSTSDPLINWNGKDKHSGKLLAQGVYFYFGEVFVNTYTGEKSQIVSGYVHIVY